MPEKMKVLLVAKFSEVEPLGVAYLSAALKKAGHECRIYLYKDGVFLPLEFTKQANEYKPSIIGFSVYTGEQDRVYSLCKTIKDIPIAIGGPHATFFYKECQPYAKYVFRGEAIKSFPVLDDYKIYPLAPVSEIPHPDRKGLYEVSEFHRNNRIKNIMCSFGCHFDCSYCYNPALKELYGDGYKVRLRPVDDVMDEAREIDAPFIFFQDDCFGYNLSWLEEFARKWDGKSYHCQIRFEMATDERLGLLKRSGCTGITAAIESANRDIRFRLLNRKIEDEQILKGAERIKKHGLKLRTEQMLGIPDTTFEDDLKLLEWNERIQPTTAWVSIFQPYRGTPLGEYCVEKKYYTGDNKDIGVNFFDRSVLNFDPQRKVQIERLQKIFAICTYLPEGTKLARKVIAEGLSIEPHIKSHLYGILYS